MVMAARSVALGVAVAAASTVLVQAAPLESNPYTPVELNTPLTASHPAYGAKPKGDCVKPVIPLDPNAAHAQSMAAHRDAASRKLRDMEASGSDMDDLASFFGEKLEVDFTTHQQKYAYASASTAPWPGSYWPTFQDGINHVWRHGEAPASEKYAKAFDLDAADLKNKTSANNGIDSCHTNTVCSSDADCSSGVPCAKREGASSGYCIPTWYGICHAWAPAALLEDEPKCNVEKNGVTFHVMDIKALLTEVYDGANVDTVFTGARFNGPDNPASVDQYGRFTDATRRDIGAGFFHIAISNIMGKHQTPFIIDVAADSEVWNQPVWSYHVQTMEIVDTAETCTKYFGTTSYPFNTEMVQLAYVKTTVTWAVEAYIDGPLVSTGKVNSYTVSNDYEYLLELDANNAIIGGEWVGDSKEDHPDFLWFATAKPDISTETSAGLKYANVRDLLELSLACNSTNNELPTVETNDTTPEPTPPATTKGDTESGKGKTGNDKTTMVPTETTPVPTPTDELTPVPTPTPSTPYGPDAPTATEDATEAPTPALTTSTPELESTPAPTTVMPESESAIAPTSTPYSLVATSRYDPASTSSFCGGGFEMTPVPTSVAVEAYAPESSKLEYSPTPVPTTPVFIGEEQATPLPTPVAGEISEVSAPETSELLYSPSSVSTITRVTSAGDVYAPEVDIPLEIVTPAPTAPISQLEQGYPGQSNPRKDDYRQPDVSVEDAQSVDQPTSAQHPMCA
ncbi:hypothetical protein PF008_g12409 [Phytophthora fragariae]|uniref:Transglutaminase elicitor n=1 Tax=Phytophthora fragariae TaxID=53985 RepID=A0A6G0RPD4_9STRA|nr:hypothetical protein PF008_g12409 [Phytophthora fragariae]